MRTLILSVVLLSIFCSVLGQLSAGGDWIGTWSNGKRGSGSLYICTDQATKTAYGSYGNIGLISGYLWGNTFTGYWYEAGYDRPFGPFQLTISSGGTSFSGTWSYFADDNQTPNGTVAWSGTKSSSAQPDARTKCLFPATLGGSSQGAYEQNNYICDHSTIDWLDSRQPAFSGSFDGFGKVQGYSPDSGTTLLLSDFYFPDDEDTDRSKYRPENANNIGAAYENLPDNHGADDDDTILTSRVVVGRFVDQKTFCGWFWYGFYGTVVNANPVCLERLENVAVDPEACAYTLTDVKQQDHKYDDGNTSQLIKNIQDAFDQLTLPSFAIDVIKGQNDGSGAPPNAKDINQVKYIQDEEYVVVCNSASSLLASVAALFALFFAF